jgi:hypothetical protein
MAEHCSTTEKPKTIRDFFRSSYFWRPFLGVAIGGLGGFLYYYFIGCSSGSCAITSNPYMSTLWGSLFGYLLVGSRCARKC